MVYFSLAIGFILIVFLSYATFGLWTKYTNAKIVRVVLFPGAIIHELSHALLCLVTGTTIKELNLFASNNTGIKYDKPMVPFVFDFVIVSAPMFACAFFIFFISMILSKPIHIGNTFPQEIHFTFRGLFDVMQNLINTVWITLNAFKDQLHIKNIRHIFFLLAIVIFTVSMSPHKQDIKHLVIGTGALSLILFLLEKIGLHLLKYSWWKYCINEFWVIITLTISVLATLLFITLIVMGSVKAYRLTFGHKGSGK